MRARRSLNDLTATSLLIALFAVSYAISPVTACARLLARIPASHRTHRVLLGSELSPSRVLPPCIPAVQGSIPSTKAAPNLTARTFVDDTPPPSQEALQSTRVEPATRSAGALLFLAAPPRNPQLAVSNRQRAP